MKDTRFIIAAILIVALGALGFAEWQRIQKLQTEITELRADAKTQADAAASAQAEIEKLRQKNADQKQVIAQLDTPQKKAAAAEEAAKALAENKSAEDAAAGGNPGANPDFGKMMKKMFTDPSMKKVMRGTQGVAIKMMYGSLGKEIGIKGPEGDQLMELLTDRQMSRINKGMKLGENQNGDATPAEEAPADGEKTEKDLDAEIESLIGKDGMAKLANYEKTVADRMQLAQYEQSFSTSGMALNEQQSQSLLGIMTEERAKQPPSPFDPASKDVNASMKAMQSEDTMKKLMDSQIHLNEQVLMRAAPVLTPDQMVQFRQIQQEQLDMQKMQLDMARAMFKGK